MSLPVEITVCVLLAPVAAATCMLIFAARRISDPKIGLYLASVTGCAAGYLALPWTRWWPEDTWERVPYLAIAAAVVAVFLEVHQAPVALRRLIRGLTSGTIAWLLIPTWNDMLPRWYLWLAVLSLAIMLSWSAIERLGCSWHPVGHVAVLAALLLTACPILFLSGNLKFAELTAALFVAALATCVATSVQRQPGGLVACAPIVAVSLPGLMLNGYFYSFSAVPVSSYFLVIAAPLMLCVPDLWATRHPRSKWALLHRASFGVALPFALIIAALA